VSREACLQLSVKHLLLCEIWGSQGYELVYYGITRCEVV
jgi:hypothetical protein